MAYAYDNQGVVEKIMKDFATAAGQMSPEGLAGYNPALTPRYDLEKAKALMVEAGYPDGFEATMISPNNRYVNDEKLAEAFVSMISKLGIKISLKTMPKAQYWDQFDAQVADIQMIGWHPDSEDSGNYYEFLSMCRNAETGYGQYNSGNYCNAKVDELTPPPPPPPPGRPDRDGHGQAVRHVAGSGKAPVRRSRIHPPALAAPVLGLQDGHEHRRHHQRHELPLLRGPGRQVAENGTCRRHQRQTRGTRTTTGFPFHTK